MTAVAEAPTPSNSVSAPQTVGTINQQFFLEPLQGGKTPQEYMEHFPDTLYNKSLESNLVALMYALLGPAGIGALRQNYLQARLAIEANGLQTAQLDELYANPLSFARFAEESYEEDTEGLLNQEQWTKIKASDASYKNRAVNWLKALRAGGTLLGIQLAAKSGLDRSVEVIENYRYLYDQYSDDPLDLEYLGVTRSTEEVVILPQQELPKNSVQVMSVQGNAIEGEFRLAFPLGAGENVKSFIEGKERGSDNEESFAIKLEPGKGIDPHIIQEALEALRNVGFGNVLVTGGPFPAHPVEIIFIGALAERAVPPLLVTSNTLVDPEHKQTVIEIEQSQAGISADGTIATIPPEDWYFAQTAINIIKPMTTIVSKGKAPGKTRRQLANLNAADSEFVNVLRYATGNLGVNWPPLDSTHWIEGGIEHEAPVSINGEQSHYTNFHNINTAVAYTGEAVTDPDYETDSPEEIAATFKDEKVGKFGRQSEVFPFLTGYAIENEQEQFFALQALANPPSTQTFTEGELIEGSYPADYTALPGVGLTAHPGAISLGGKGKQTPIWASAEAKEGIDYLEIDLGTVQAVNYLRFEASNKPYDIDVAYDLLDAFPERRFKAVTYASESIINPETGQAEVALHGTASVLQLGHNPLSPNPWRTIEINFTNSLNRMLYTRFIRVGFTRRTGEETVFSTPTEKIPYSIEVRNLRLGRNIS